jgi:hypothetical protein
MVGAVTYLHVPCLACESRGVSQPCTECRQLPRGDCRVLSPSLRRVAAVARPHRRRPTGWTSHEGNKLVPRDAQGTMPILRGRQPERIRALVRPLSVCKGVTVVFTHGHPQ